MPKFETEVPNPLGKEQATHRLKNIIEHMVEKFKDQVSDVSNVWENNRLNFSLKTYGFKVDGELTVEDDAVRCNGNLPLAAMMFRKKIEESLTSELQRLLS